MYYKIYGYYTGSGYLLFSDYNSKTNNILDAYEEWSKFDSLQNIYCKMLKIDTKEIINIVNEKGIKLYLSDIEFKEYIWKAMKKDKYATYSFFFENEDDRYVKSKFENCDYYYAHKWSYILTKEEKAIVNDILKNRTYEEIYTSYTTNDLKQIYKMFDSDVGFNKYDIIVYPDVSHNNLVKVMIDLLKEQLRENKNNISNKVKLFEITKTNPAEISYECYANKKYNFDDLTDWINNIHSLDYFSIAKNGGKYRKEARDFLTIDNGKFINEIKNADKDSKLLIVDDINTTGSTLKEILKKINKR